MGKKLLILAALSGAIIALDQATKMYVITQFALHEQYSVIQGFFDFTYVQNRGAAFGFLADSHPTFRGIFFTVMPPIALIIILSLLRSVPDEDKWQICALSAVFGGAIGNYIDRLRFGYVIDFLDFHWKNSWTYPAFNVADIAIVCGVIILMGLMVRDMKEEQRQKQKTT